MTTMMIIIIIIIKSPMEIHHFFSILTETNNVTMLQFSFSTFVCQASQSVGFRFRFIVHQIIIFISTWTWSLQLAVSFAFFPISFRLFPITQINVRVYVCTMSLSSYFFPTLFTYTQACWYYKQKGKKETKM